ncbi:hypothetical protein EJB05_47478, partial [Eragrostis curvula]
MECYMDPSGLPSIRTWPMPDEVSLNSYKFLVSEEHKFLVLHTLWLELLEKMIVSLLGALYVGHCDPSTTMTTDCNLSVRDGTEPLIKLLERSITWSFSMMASEAGTIPWNELLFMISDSRFGSEEP